MNFNIDSEDERLAAKNLFDGNLVHGAKRFHHETARSGKGRPASGYIVPAHAKVVEDTGCDQYQRKEEFWEAVDICPVCGSKSQTDFLQRYGLNIVRCSDCNHRYQNPRIKFDKLTELYANDPSPVKVYNSEMQKSIDWVKYNYGLSLVEQIDSNSKNKILDIGCGAGGFLYAAHEQGWKQCVGVDINENWASNYSDSEAVQFINSTYESLSEDTIGSQYDVVSMWNVLEHMTDLHFTVSTIKKLLKPGGLFFIMVPNVESLASRIIRSLSPTFNWKHVSHFCHESLSTLMSNHEFSECHFETAITEIDNIKSYLSGEYPYHGHGDPDGLFDFITPEYIHANHLGSRIIAIYKNDKS